MARQAVKTRSTSEKRKGTLRPVTLNVQAQDRYKSGQRLGGTPKCPCFPGRVYARRGTTRGALAACLACGTVREVR